MVEARVPGDSAGSDERIARMDLFGLKEHEEQHATAERVLRRLVEQVGQLSVDLGQTRMDLRRLALVVEGKVGAAEVDPLLAATNDALDRARGRLADLVAAADEQWDEISARFDEAVAAARAETDAPIGDVADDR